MKWVAVHGGKGGYMIRVSRGEGSDYVVEEQNDLLARALRLEKCGRRGRARSKEERA